MIFFNWRLFFPPVPSLCHPLSISLKCDIDICPLEPHKQQNLAQLSSYVICPQSMCRRKPGCRNLTPYSAANALSQGSRVGLLASFLPVISGSLKPASLAPCSLGPGEKCSDCSGCIAEAGALPSLQSALPWSDFHCPLSWALASRACSLVQFYTDFLSCFRSFRGFVVVNHLM